MIILMHVFSVEETKNISTSFKGLKQKRLTTKKKMQKSQTTTRSYELKPDPKCSLLEVLDL